MSIRIVTKRVIIIKVQNSYKDSTLINKSK